MRGIISRLQDLEQKMAVHRHPAAVAAWLMTSAQADEVARILATCGDDVLEDVVKHQLGLPADAVLTDELLEVIVAGKLGGSDGTN